MAIILYYNANCMDCVQLAKSTEKLDWFNRIELTTSESPQGEVPIGEIVVVEKNDNKFYTGVYATRKVCLQIPSYFLYGIALFIPFVRNIVGKNKPGCNGESCEI